MKIIFEASAGELSDFISKIQSQGKKLVKEPEELFRKIVREEMSRTIGQIKNGKLQFVANADRKAEKPDALPILEDGEETAEETAEATE